MKKKTVLCIVGDILTLWPMDWPREFYFFVNNHYTAYQSLAIFSSSLSGNCFLCILCMVFLTLVYSCFRSDFSANSSIKGNG